MFAGQFADLLPLAFLRRRGAISRSGRRLNSFRLQSEVRHAKPGSQGLQDHMDRYFSQIHAGLVPDFDRDSGGPENQVKVLNWRVR